MSPSLAVQRRSSLKSWYRQTESRTQNLERSDKVCRDKGGFPRTEGLKALAAFSSRVA